MDWDDTDLDTEVDLTDAELTHLQRLTDADADGDGFFFAAAVVFFTAGAAAVPPLPDRRVDVFCVVPGDILMFVRVALRPYTSLILILKGPGPAPPSMIQ